MCPLNILSFMLPLWSFHPQVYSNESNWQVYYILNLCTNCNNTYSAHLNMLCVVLLHLSN